MLLSDEDDARAAIKISDFGLARQVGARGGVAEMARRVKSYVCVRVPSPLMARRIRSCLFLPSPLGSPSRERSRAFFGHVSLSTTWGTHRRYLPRAF